MVAATKNEIGLRWAPIWWPADQVWTQCTVDVRQVQLRDDELAMDVAAAGIIDRTGTGTRGRSHSQDLASIDRASRDGNADNASRRVIPAASKAKTSDGATFAVDVKASRGRQGRRRSLDYALRSVVCWRR
eukprot:SAG31_NODE_11606_length_1014_cov_0.480874_1_plen_130_part_10